MRSLAFAGLLITAATAAAAEPAPQPVLARSEMMADLEQFGAAVKQGWAYADYRRSTGVDVDTLLADAVAGLPERSERSEFAQLMRRMVAALQDGHAWVAAPGLDDRGDRVWPFSLVDTREGLVVDRVDPKLRAPRRGDILVAVGEVPLSELLGTAMEVASASTNGMRRARALQTLRLTRALRSRFTFRRTSGRLFVIDLKNQPLPTTATPRSSSSAWLGRKKLPGDVGYIRIASFTALDQRRWREALPSERDALIADQYDDIDQAFDAVANSRAVVLDLRGNSGGTDMLAMRLAQHLVPGGSPFYRLEDPGAGSGTAAPSPAVMIPAAPSFTPYPGQLTVLIDELSFSTADNLIACLRAVRPKAVFVGRPSGGGSGAPRLAVKLAHSGFEVGYSTLRVYDPAGNLIEGHGTIPDILVEKTRADVIAQRDPDLVAALHKLGRR